MMLSMIPNWQWPNVFMDESIFFLNLERRTSFPSSGFVHRHTRALGINDVIRACCAPMAERVEQNLQRRTYLGIYTRR